MNKKELVEWMTEVIDGPIPSEYINILKVVLTSYVQVEVTFTYEYISVEIPALEEMEVFSYGESEIETLEEAVRFIQSKEAY